MRTDGTQNLQNLLYCGAVFDATHESKTLEERAVIFRLVGQIVLAFKVQSPTGLVFSSSLRTHHRSSLPPRCSLASGVPAGASSTPAPPATPASAGDSASLPSSRSKSGFPLPRLGRACSKKVLMLVSSLLRPTTSSRGSTNSRVAAAEGGSNDDEPVTSLRALQDRLRLNPSAFSSALRLWLRQEDALDAERLEARGGLLGAVLKAILRA